MVTATGQYFPIVLGGTVLLLAVTILARRANRRWLGRCFRRAHPGKDLLIVYTDSPHWKDYIESKWVARWSDRTVLLNRSRPWSREQPEAQLWLTLAGLTEHTPLAIVVSPSGRAQVIRFFSAFQDFKHGKDQWLRSAEEELEKAMEGRHDAGA